MHWAIALTPGPLTELPQRVKDAAPQAKAFAQGEPSDLFDDDVAQGLKLAQQAARHLGARPDSNVTVAISGISNPTRGGTEATPRDNLSVSVSLAETPPVP